MRLYVMIFWQKSLFNKKQKEKEKRREWIKPIVKSSQQTSMDPEEQSLRSSNEKSLSCNGTLWAMKTHPSPNRSQNVPTVAEIKSPQLNTQNATLPSTDHLPIAEGSHRSHVDSGCVCLRGEILLFYTLILNLSSNLWHHRGGEGDGRQRYRARREGWTVALRSPHVLVWLAGGVAATLDGILAGLSRLW